MLKLRTVYLYSLNDWLGDEYKKDKTDVLEGNKFPRLPKKRNMISGRTSYKNHKQ